MTIFQGKLLTATESDEAVDYVVPNVLSKAPSLQTQHTCRLYIVPPPCKCNICVNFIDIHCLDYLNHPGLFYFSFFFYSV